MTTAGFGDMIPLTVVGKLITIPILLAGILLIALPSIIVGRNFAVAWSKLKGKRVKSPL
jgi:hypothetical protein